MRRPTVLLAVLAVTAAACSSGGPAATTAAPDAAGEGAALDYALSARRAIEGTRFATLSDRDVAALVLDLCADLEDSADPDGDVIAFLAGVEAPPGEEVDDRIMAVVLAEGALAVCPAVIDAAALRAWEAAPPEDRFLAGVESVAPELDDGPSPDVLLAAGAAVCEVLNAGGGPDGAVAAEFAVLFGVEGVDAGEITSGAAGEREALLAGAVLGSAASFLCPTHRETVLSYLEGLAEEQR